MSSNVTFRLSQRHPSLAVAVCLLGLTQIIGYGTLYYGFAPLANDMAQSFGWPVSWIFGAFSPAAPARTRRWWGGGSTGTARRR